MTQTATAHGLDGTMVEPDWPPLTVPELRRLLRQFPDCGEPIRILSVSPRPFSAASVVATSNGRVFVKRHHYKVRDREGLLEEHRFLAHLRAQGATVPRVLKTASGESAIEIGEWMYEVHESAAGVDLYKDAVSWTPFRFTAHAHSAGAALARLHLASQGFAVPRRAARPLVASFTIFAGDNPAVELESYLEARPALACDLTLRDHCNQALELLAPFHAELQPQLPALQPLWTHNDLHASNLLWSDTRSDACAVEIIDFGLADRTNAVHDLAHAIERNIVEWLALADDPAHAENVPVHLDHLEALLSGYDSVRRLSDEEAAALAPMTALCHAEFALSETDYFLSVLHSEEKARLADDDYLLGHSRWFRGPCGAKLLDAMRRWAENRSGTTGGRS